MLRAGTILLTVWAAANGVVALVVTAMTVSGHAPPALALVFSPEEIGRLDRKAVAVVNAQAAIANPCIAALCALVIILTWTSIAKRARWAFWAVTCALLPVQAFGFVSDAFLGNANVVANTVSLFVLAGSLGLAGYGVLRAPPRETVHALDG